MAARSEPIRATDSLDIQSAGMFTVLRNSPRA
jgi:hypothetical protein